MLFVAYIVSIAVAVVGVLASTALVFWDVLLPDAANRKRNPRREALGYNIAITLPVFTAIVFAISIAVSLPGR